MKVICDTNVWYDLGVGAFDLKKVDSLPLCATLTNIQELAETKNYIGRIEVVRGALRQIFMRKPLITYYNPMEYIVTLQDKSYPIDWKKIASMLDFTEGIANGNVIAPGMEDFAASYFGNLKNDLISATSDINVDLVQHQINREEVLILEQNNFEDLNRRRIIAQVTSIFPEFKFDPNFDWNQLELLTHTIGAWVQELIATDKKIRLNDWHDILMLAYVQPGDKFWTGEKKWRRLITERGLSDYLIDGDALRA